MYIPYVIKYYLQGHYALVEVTLDRRWSHRHHGNGFLHER